MWYTNTVEYCSVIKKNKTMPFAATWVDQETLILSESDTNIPLICGILKKKKGTKKLIPQTQVEPQI